MEEKKQLLVKGMTCAACSASVQQAVNKLEGVHASVNLATETLTYTLSHPHDMKEYEIIRTVESLGYGIEKEISQHSGSNFYIRQKKKERIYFARVQLAILFLVPLALISMGPMWGILFLEPLASKSFIYGLIQFLLLLPILYAGRSFFTKGYKSLWHLRPNMDSLIAVGASASVLFSLINWFELLPGSTHLYFESAGMIITFILLGKWLESKASANTGKALQDLEKVLPAQASVFRDGTIQSIDIKQVKRNDLLVVKPGEKIPVDGRIQKGKSLVDESVLTGESVLKSKQAGDNVIGGSINHDGSLQIIAYREANEGFIAQIISMVEEAQGQKAPIARIADRISLWFVPAVFLISLLSATGWILGGQSIHFVLQTTISILVIACPCAMGLATPAAILVGTGKAASKGILFKEAKSLELFSKVNVIAFDKTGTLTQNKPEIIHIDSNNEDETFQLAGSLETFASHPFAEAIVRGMKDRSLPALDVSDFINYPGEGIEGTIEKNRIRIGRKRFSLGNDVDDFHEEQELGSEVYISKDFSWIGTLWLEDALRKESKQVIEAFRSMGVKTLLLTGDRQRIGAKIGRLLHIDEIETDLLPQDKRRILSELPSTDTVAFVGDGINDAPALAEADLGIALGAGTDLAIESADILLIRSDLNLLVEAWEISKTTLKVIKQNLFWALAFNAISIPIAAGVLYSSTGLLLTPGIAAIAMSFSSISVVLNSLRIKTKRYISL
jgi:Cu+-exporting ATPase